jgi:hypothetical protein
LDYLLVNNEVRVFNKLKSNLKIRVSARVPNSVRESVVFRLVSHEL